MRLITRHTNSPLRIHIASQRKIKRGERIHLTRVRHTRDSPSPSSLNAREHASACSRPNFHVPSNRETKNLAYIPQQMNITNEKEMNSDKARYPEKFM